MTASPSLSRSFSAVAVVGRIARDIARSPDTLCCALTILLTVLLLAMKTWGLAALAPGALAAVPVIFLLPIAITRG
jgi:hypothetical protein